MTPLWQSLFANLALVAILVIVWDFVAVWTSRLAAWVQSSFLGVVLAAGTIVSMITAQPLVPGVIFDLRSALIAGAAFFGGWPAAIIASAVALVYRFHLGGQGANAGYLAIIIVAAVGLMFHQRRKDCNRTVWCVVAFSVAVAFGNMLAYAALPAEIRLPLLARTGFPLASLVFVSSLMVCILFVRQERQRELTKSNMIYRAMVEELPDCLNVKDLEGRFLAANRATAVLMRTRSPEDLIGRTDYDFYPAALARSFRQDEIAMLETGEPIRSQQPALFPDDSSGWLSTLKAPLTDSDGKAIGIISHNRDITLEVRNTTFKNEFISTVSHELRTPLTSIRGSLGLIASGAVGTIPPKVQSLLRIAHSNSERLVRLVNDILDMEKIESGKMTFDMRRMPVRAAVDQAVSASQSYLPEQGVKLAVVDEAPDAEVDVDPDRLQQVLLNLLSNAVKFSRAGGIVTARISRPGPDSVRVTVADTGAGIPEEFQSRIFGKFEQADASDTREKGGTGLGLSISKTIVEKLGGTIDFESTVGAGSQFYFDLPELPRLADREDDTAHADGIVDERPRVLICEDDADVSRVIAALLDVHGYASDAAPDVDCAKVLLSKRDYAALTLDINLAGRSGIALFQELHGLARNRNVPVIVISAVADQTRQSLQGSAVGIVDWLEKPIDPQRLRTALSRMTENQSDGRPRVLHVEGDGATWISADLQRNFAVTTARTLQHAADLTKVRHFDLIIIDVALPDGSGLELLSHLPAETAVIVFASMESEDRLEGVKAIMTRRTAAQLDLPSLVGGFLAQGVQREPEPLAVRSKT